MSQIEIIPAKTQAQFDQFRALLREYADSPGGKLCCVDVALELKELPKLYKAPLGGLWLATVDGQIAGGIAMRPLRMILVEITRLYVRPEFRNRGLGRLLINAAITAAGRARCHGAQLDTLPSMKESRRLFERLGFQVLKPSLGENDPIRMALRFH